MYNLPVADQLQSLMWDMSCTAMQQELLLLALCLAQLVPHNCCMWITQISIVSLSRTSLLFVYCLLLSHPFISFP